MFFSRWPMAEIMIMLLTNHFILRVVLMLLHIFYFTNVTYNYKHEPSLGYIINHMVWATFLQVIIRPKKTYSNTEITINFMFASLS